MVWENEPIPGGWKFTNGDAQIILDYLYPVGRGLEAWVELRDGEHETPLASGRRDLTTADAIQPFLRHLPDEAPVNYWADGLREAFYFAIQADRQGAATLDLADVEARGLTFLVEPIIETGGSTRLIAPGGSGKSLLAMALALSVALDTHKFLGLAPQASGPVLYCDWETDASTHRQRIEALCAPHGIPVPERGRIIYRPERAPLSRSIQAVTRDLRAHKAVLVVIDSAKMAAGPSGQSSGEEATLGLYTAIRELAVPALIIDHKNREDIAKGRRGGYGNIFMENLARLQWEFTHHQPSTKRFVLELTKENNVGQRPALGFELKAKGGDQGLTSAEFRQIDPDIVRQSDDEGRGDKIDSLYTSSSEPMTVKKVSELTGIPQGSVRAYFNQNTYRYFNVNEGRKGKPALWRPKEEYLSGPSDDGEQEPLEHLIPPPDDVDVF